MILTFSRTGTLSIVIALIAYGLLSKKNRKLSIVALSIIIPISIIIYYQLNQYTDGILFFRYTDKLDSNRFMLMEAAYNIFLDNILIGIGSGNFGYELIDRGISNFYIGVHNPFLKYYVETGIFAGSIFSLYFLSLGIKSFLSKERLLIVPLLLMFIIIASSIDFKLVIQLYMLFIISLVVNNKSHIL
tara:strand:- start:124 stop:687 length:564 start_codon:yes stop_codon:yes gene_type:complete